MRAAAFVLVALVACDRPTAKPTPIVAPVDSTPSASVAIDREAAPPLDAGAADAAKVVDGCPPPGPGKTSDDETPTLRGGKDDALTFEWLEKRGVSKTAAIAWYTARFGVAGLGRDAVEGIFGSAQCKTIAVGDKAEEAIFCSHTIHYSWMQTRVLVLTVRNKQIAALLDVGLGMRALDWPDARHLDLAFSIDADGKSAELVDRAPEGTILVEPPSACRARMATSSPRLPTLPSGMAYPAKLHDCAGGIAEMKKTQSDLAAADPSMKKEVREALSFIERACKDRGRYVWRGDKFVRP